MGRDGKLKEHFAPESIANKELESFQLESRIKNYESDDLNDDEINEWPGLDPCDYRGG